MNRLILLLTPFLLATPLIAAPLRVFIRGGAKSHGPNAHEHEKFLNDWKSILTERGVTADGAKDWPTAEQLAVTDVLVMYAQEGGNATDAQKANLAEFTKRGGGIVVIHTASVSNDPVWWKSVIGGAWVQGKTKWKEGPMDLYYVENQRIGETHPITQGASNFHIDDEIYYDMDLSPDIRVLATSYTPNVPGGKKPVAGGKTTIYDIQPQMWTYEKDEYRAFVSLPGHLYTTFEKPYYRAILMRGIAWAGKRKNIDEFCKPEEIDSLTYPEEGPQRPDDTLKALEIHPDFTMKLLASEPLITKPMNFDWDPAGRMWVAETPEYPNGRRGMRPDYRGKEWKDHGGIDPTPGKQERKAQDKISILTDTNGDGVMDKKELFYEGLELVTGLVFHKDGVIVTQAPDILWLRDTDHDGKADKVEKLYTGLGTGDTHAVINNPRWGWDGWIYCTHGYSSGKVTSADGSIKFGTIGSGVVRFKPDGTAFEQYSSKGGNTWGLDITADNRVMWTQPTSGDLLMETVIPEHALSRGKVAKTGSYHVVEKSGKTFPALAWEEIPYLQIDWVGSFTAAAGCAIYDGGSWPAEYNGDYFTTEPTINIVHHARLTPHATSSSFHKLSGREETEFIRSKDMWWRPIEVRVGPDGAMYVGDFYNQAVVHNDTRGPDHNEVNAAVRPDRDHYFGRIWRVDHKNAKKNPVPDLSHADVSGLVKALEHPNKVVRMTAYRLLLERPESKPYGTPPKHTDEDRKVFSAQLESDFGFASLVKLAGNTTKSNEARIAAIWTLAHRGEVEGPFLSDWWLIGLNDKDPDVRRNAANAWECRLAATADTPGKDRNVPEQLISLLADSNASVRLAALRALSSGSASQTPAKSIVAAWPKFDDDFQKSAAIGAASRDPSATIAAAIDSRDSTALSPLVNALTPLIKTADDAANLVILLSTKSGAADSLKASILDSIAKNVVDTPTLTPVLSEALEKLLISGASDSALPLAAKWDKSGSLKTVIESQSRKLFTKLEAGSDDARFAAAQGLLGLRSVSDAALPAVLKITTGDASPALKTRLVTALAATGDPQVGAMLASSFSTFPAEVRGTAFDILLQRGEWALALLEAAKEKKADITTLGPANLARLRTHPDAKVAKTANSILDELMGPAMKAKSDIIDHLAAEVEKPGDAAKGRILFTAACATCHKLNDQGSDIGPGLTGMGAHGPTELLKAIIDPNREVDPSFVAHHIETKDGKVHAGIIARENPTSLIMRSLAGEEEIRIADIKSRVNTGRSLMPEGLEGLGGETLRDILAYICGADAGKFRVLDLHGAFTTSTARGLYQSAAATDQSFQFKKTGAVTIEGIPFNIVPPEKAAGGSNIIVLKGGPGNSFAQTMPQRVEIKGGGFKANRLHFLGGVTGWGFQNNDDRSDVLKITVRAVGGASETIVCKNGTEFSDYINRLDVPGSKFAKGIVKDHQLRWFTKALKSTVEIESIVLESFASNAAPTTVAITAELADAKSASVPTPEAAPGKPAGPPGFKAQFNDPVPKPPATAKGPRVLLVGGGSSHDFVKFFGASDKATLAPVVGWVDFTQNLNGIAPILKDIDVLVLSANQPISPETQKALIDFANSGKGIIPIHPGCWHAWENFPLWNKEIVGGGTRGHDPLGSFTVKVSNANHPVTKGMSPTFEITDELYHFNTIPGSTPIEVLAEATSPKTGKTFPQVFVVKHPKSRIVGITLGHDARAHDLQDFQTLLKNAVIWASEK